MYLRTWQQSMTTILQPAHCDLQPEIQEVHRTTHTHTHDQPLAAEYRGGTDHTEKHKVSCSGFLPHTSPMQHSCSHYNGFCSTTYTSMQPLQCGLHPRVAEHQGGTDYVRNGPNRSRTHKIPSIGACSHFTRKNTRFRAPASSPTHATFMQHPRMVLKN